MLSPSLSASSIRLASAVGDNLEGPSDPSRRLYLSRLPNDADTPSAGGVDTVEDGRSSCLIASRGTSPAGTTMDPLRRYLATDFGDTERTCTFLANSTGQNACKKYLRIGEA